MWQSIRQSIITIVGILSAVIGIWVFYTATWGLMSNDGKAAIWILGGLSIWLFLDNRVILFRISRSARFADIIPLLNTGFADIHNYFRGEPDLFKSVKALEHLCNSLSRSMTLVTGANCVVSIKILVNDTSEGFPRLRAQTFCRSSKKRNTAQYSDVKHWVDRNTDFREIFEHIDKKRGYCFFSNNLPLRYGYQNTSFEIYGGEPSTSNWFMRYWRWPLPYKSTIVVPITPIEEAKQENLIGFLCVDSNRLVTFRHSEDVELMRGVADGLYNVLNPLPEPSRVAEGRELI